MMRVYKFRLYPSEKQERVLLDHFDCCRFTYNKLLEELSKNKDRKHVQHCIVELKKQYSQLKNVYSKTLQYECYRLFSNLKTLSQLKNKNHKVGSLRFKGRDWFKTIVYNQSGFKIINTNKRYNVLHLSKIGSIKMLQHRVIDGKIKGVIIKKKASSWEAHVITNAKYSLNKGIGVVGLDMGIMSFITDQNGNKTSNPLYLKNSLDLLKKKQQNVSRKQKGSRNRWKSKKQVQKLHEHIVNQRNDFLHKLTTKLVQKNCFIAVENLNIKKLQTISYNCRNMNDSSWGTFLLMLDFKAESAGCQVIKVNPKNTTKECSNCGNLKNIELWQRTYDCENCSISLDRDTNAANNILRLALEQGNAKMNRSSSMKQEALTSTPISVRSG